MYDEIKIRTESLLLSLSDAMDLACPAIAVHGLRTAFIAGEIGRLAQLDALQRQALFAATLLHDIGALSVEEKVRLVTEEEKDPEPHCIRGAAFLSRISFLRQLSPIIRDHHRRWDEWPQGEHTPDTLLAQIVSLADHVDRALDRQEFILCQDEKVRKRARGLAGGAIDPDVVDLFLRAAEGEAFWLDMESSRLHSVLLDRNPNDGKLLGIAELLEVSETSRDIIDFRSRFTATHSSGVAKSAVLIAEAFGMSEPEIRLIEIAGNVHDLGKLSVPNSILEKPGQLTAAEFRLMNRHAYDTYSVLSRIEGMGRLPGWAAFHHERLDGEGYPFRLDREKLDCGARILAVADVFTALAEDRPYRKGMAEAAIARILSEMVNDGKLDQRVVRTLSDDMSGIRAAVGESQAALREFYETGFMALADKAS